MATTIERVEVARDGHWSSRSISILAALAVDAGLIWLLFFRAPYNPPVGDAEMFWVRVLAAFGAYAVLQQWTLANQTGRGDDLSSALDKFVAASPTVVALVIEAYWLGAQGVDALSWRHHAVAVLWSAFAITDFFATDITNQRLRARQFNVGDGGAA
jgi:hypothetical protein